MKSKNLTGALPRSAKGLARRAFARDNVKTVKLARNGREVLAKPFDGELMAVTYANRTQAQRKVDELGAGWEVCQFSGRPFYVAKALDSHGSADEVVGTVGDICGQKAGGK